MKKKVVSMGITMLLLSSILLMTFEIRTVVASEQITAPTDGTQNIILNGSTTWYWTSNTEINAVGYGDFNDDLQTEIVTGGCFFDGTRNVAQLIIWNSTNLAKENLTTWYWTGNTTINSLVVDDVNADNQTEIVTGGSYFDGTRNVAQLVVWNASSLTEEKVTSWYWNGDTVINSIAVGDVNSDGQKEIVSAGYYNDGTRNIAQLAVWSGSSLTLEKVTSRCSTGNTVIKSIAIDDVDNDGQVEIVSGGYYNDSTHNVAELIEWRGTDLVVDRLKSWYWTGNTTINSIDIGDVDKDGQVEIVTGGYYNDGVRSVAQLVAWSGFNLTVDRLTGWYWIENTTINSVAIVDVDGDGKMEIVTAGHYFDGIRNNAQIVVWSGSNLAVENVKTWYWTNGTSINSVVAGNINGNISDKIISGGEYLDGTHSHAQLTVWSIAQNSSSNYRLFGSDFSPYMLTVLLVSIILIMFASFIVFWFLRKKPKK